MKPNFKKMLATIGLLAVAVPTTLSVVACGSTTENSQTDLKDVIKETTIAGSLGETESTVLDKVVALNKGLVKDELAVKSGSFNAADYGKPGSAIIVAKADKFTGEVKITITALEKTDLKDVIKETTIAGSLGDTESTVLDKVVALNKGLVKDELGVKSGSFNAADYGKPGSAVIVAKAAKFTGEVKITITAIPVPKIEEIVNQVREKIYEDVHIASEEPAQVFELTEEQLKLSDEQIKEILSKQIFALLTTKHPEVKGLIKDFKIADIKDWGGRKREWPTGDEVRKAIAEKGIWVPEQRSDNKYKLLTVGFRITDINGNESPEPILGERVDDNGEGNYPNSFGILWNVNIGIKQK